MGAYNDLRYFDRARLSVDQLSPIDAFGRIRVSEPFTLFDSKQLFDNLPLTFDDQQVSGSGTNSTYSQARASTTLSVSANTAGKRVRQSKLRHNYQPAKSQLGIFTFIMGETSAGIIKRVGLFDDNNGVFFESNGGTLAFVIRSKVSGEVVENRITQANWNNDSQDGDSFSQLILDESKNQIFYLDFEWLGTGDVRFGFYHDGTPVLCHTAHHDNVTTSVYMSTPNLPVRYEIINDGTGAADTFEVVCSSVISEGGFNPQGVIHAIDRGITSYTTGNNTSIHPLISMRIKSTHIGATVIPIQASILTASNINHRWLLVLNPTIAGVDGASWTSVTNSAVEYDITRSTTNTLSGGTVIASGYSAAGGDLNLNIETALLPGFKIDGTADQIVLAVQNTSGTGTYYGGITYRELL